jgi:hypothetical protein
VWLAPEARPNSMPRCSRLATRSRPGRTSTPSPRRRKNDDCYGNDSTRFLSPSVAALTALRMTWRTMMPGTGMAGVMSKS